MGEAKRRKQLGLMPTVFPFEAELNSEAQATILRAPEDKALRAALGRALEESQLAGAAWDSEYRTALLFSGRPMGTLYTVQDVQRIPVPPLRRVAGEIVLGKRAEDLDGPALDVPGGAARLKEQRHSFDGKKWESFPAVRDGARVRRILEEHPAFHLEGEVVGQFSLEQWQEGRIDVEPEPPAGVLEVLEGVAREWHGETPEQWAAYHAELVGPEVPAPAMRRSHFEVRRPAPLQNPTRPILTIRGGYEIYPLVGQTYSLDGETWLSYDDPDAGAQEDDFLQAFSEMLNMDTVTVTVYADGQVEWDEDAEIPDEQADRLRENMQESTGAGNPEKWAEWSREMLRDTFNAEPDAQTADIPVPLAVRLEVPLDAIADPDPLSQTFIESEVTFDGQEWRDLYDEEMPPELLLAIAKMKPPGEGN